MDLMTVKACCLGCFVLVRGCHLGEFLLPGNRLREMGEFGFYGYWACWDLHNVFWRTDSLGTMWTQKEHRGTWKPLEVLSRQAPSLPSSKSGILPHWRGGSMEPRGWRRWCVNSTPTHTGCGMCLGLNIFTPFCLLRYLSYWLKRPFSNHTERVKPVCLPTTHFTYAFSPYSPLPPDHSAVDSAITGLVSRARSQSQVSASPNPKTSGVCISKCGI